MIKILKFFRNPGCIWMHVEKFSFSVAEFGFAIVVLPAIAYTVVFQTLQDIKEIWKKRDNYTTFHGTLQLERERGYSRYR